MEGKDMKKMSIKGNESPRKEGSFRGKKKTRKKKGCSINY